MDDSLRTLSPLYPELPDKVAYSEDWMLWSLAQKERADDWMDWSPG